MRLYCPMNCKWLENGTCRRIELEGGNPVLSQQGNRFLRPESCVPTEQEMQIFYQDDVALHQNKVAKLMSAVRYLLDIQASKHDVSKLDPAESQHYIEPVFYLNNSDIEFGSGEYKEVTASMGEGWTHHKQNNPHHIEHHAEGLKDMNFLLIIEMLCDWIAAGTRNDKPYDVEASIAHVLPDADETTKSLIRNTVKLILDSLW